jgi:fumarate reductase subunit C
MEARVYLLQRVTAMILAPLIAVHLIVIVYASRGGLTAAEILSRTEGSVGWALFYGLFVVCAALHAPIGVRAVLREWTPLPPRLIDVMMAMFLVALVWLGLRAVAAVLGVGA